MWEKEFNKVKPHFQLDQTFTPKLKQQKRKSPKLYTNSTIRIYPHICPIQEVEKRRKRWTGNPKRGENYRRIRVGQRNRGKLETEEWQGWRSSAQGNSGSLLPMRKRCVSSLSRCRASQLFSIWGWRVSHSLSQNRIFVYVGKDGRTRTTDRVNLTCFLHAYLNRVGLQNHLSFD